MKSLFYITLIVFIGLTTTSPAGLSATLTCPYAQAKLGDVHMVCHKRKAFAKEARASGILYRKSSGSRDVFDVPELFPLAAKMISLYNDEQQMVMAQYIFPANDAQNSYKKIRMQLDREYGLGRRVVGDERSREVECKWRCKDGVVIRFKRKKGAPAARLTYSRPHMARAVLNKKGYK